MPTCPICSTPLETARQREGVFYPCRACNGKAVTISQIRHVQGERVAMKLLRLIERRMEEERKQARQKKKKPLHRDADLRKDAERNR